MTPFPYLPYLLLTDKKIRDRFVECLKAVLRDHTQKEVAAKLKTSGPYLSKLQKTPKPVIPSLLIARFCLEYGYSPSYILTGKEENPVKSPEEKWESEREKYLDLIGRMLEAMIEARLSGDDVVYELATEAVKRKKTN